jgi:hypothetical protein
MLGNAMANLVVTPVLFYWVLRPPNPASFSVPRSFEAAVLVLGLVITLALAFEPIAGPRDFAEWRYHAPLPFIVWAAIRFRMFGPPLQSRCSPCLRSSQRSKAPGRLRICHPRRYPAACSTFAAAVPVAYLVAVLIEQTWQVGNSLRKSEQAVSKARLISCAASGPTPR